MGVILGGLFFAAIVGAIGWAAFYVVRQDQRTRQVAAENIQLRAHAAAVDAENQRLASYAVVPDAQQEAARLLTEAAQGISDQERQIQAWQEKTAEEMNRSFSERESQLQAWQEQSILGIQTYQEQVSKWAEETTQSARTEEALSLQKKTDYEAVAGSMRNMIEGYGNQYLVPAPSLLDDLAQDFGFTDAGDKLKKARALTREMVRKGSPATSGYPDAERREAASDFVLDAFNGKVDTILASVKAENAGILEQKIKDAFMLVNNYGKTFGDTRITQAYLKARLDELKWAAIAQQLRLDEKEEQRRIKEQMREEEKARREIERAQKEAAKAQEEAAREQELLQKALEKARQEASEVGEEQKAEYEQKLRDMEARLQEAEARRQEAEEKGQKALSMAQQTKKGHVYVISNIGSFGEGIVKIGQTRRLDPLERVWELGDASVPFEFDVHAMILSDDAPGLEYQLHKHFVMSQINKVNPRKEFFRLDLAELRRDVEALGLDVKWTMTAEANQYRQTLNIEKSLETDPAFKAEWMKKQIRLKFEPPAVSGSLREVGEERDEN